VGLGLSEQTRRLRQRERQAERSALEGEHILPCTNTAPLKATGTMRGPRLALSVVDFDTPHCRAAVQSRVIDIGNDADNKVMDRIAQKCTTRRFPNGMPNRVCLVIEA
jgi:hypothetical protein